MHWKCIGGRNLDYHSYHPFYMKKSIINECVKSEFCVTSGCFWVETSDRLRVILRNSNYSNTSVKKTIKSVRTNTGTESDSPESRITEGDPLEVYNEMYGIVNVEMNHLDMNEMKYVSGPYIPDTSVGLNSTLRKFNLNMFIRFWRGYGIYYSLSFIII